MSAKTYVCSISSHQMKYSFTTLKTLLVLLVSCFFWSWAGSKDVLVYYLETCKSNKG